MEPTKDVVVFRDLARACVRYSLGREKMRQLARDACAEIRYGKKIFIDCEMVDAYLRTLKTN